MYEMHPAIPNFVRIKTKSDLEKLIEDADYCSLRFFLHDTKLKSWKVLKDEWFTMNFNHIVFLKSLLN